MARQALGLGGAATRDVGTGTGKVAAGDDSRIVGALPAVSAGDGQVTIGGTVDSIKNRFAANSDRINRAAAAQALQTGISATYTAATLGNPAVVRTPTATPAATGTFFVDGNQLASDGSLSQIQAYIDTVGNGQGRFFFSSRTGSTDKVEAVIPVTITGTGVQTFNVDLDIPPLAVKAGWRLGWWSPSGGAQIDYQASGTSFSGTNAVGPVVGGTSSLTSGTAKLAINATVYAPADVSVGRPLNAGTAGPVNNLWVETGAPLPGGLIKTLSAYVQALGNGQGSFVILSPRGAKWKIDSVIPVTFTGTGVQTLVSGTGFAPVSVAAGSVLGWFAATGGAQLAYASVGASSFVAATGVAPGAVLTLGASGARFSTAATFAGVQPITPRLTAAEQSTAALVDAMAAIPQAALVRDEIVSCVATASGNGVTISGVINRPGSGAGTGLLSFSGSVTLDAATTGTVTDEAATISATGTLAFGVNRTTGRLANANVSAVTVKDPSTSAALVEGTDYSVGYEHGVLINLGTGSRNVLVSYAWSKRRYDAIALEPNDLTLLVVKGTERTRDAAEFVPELPAPQIASGTGGRTYLRLFNARVVSGLVQTVPTWDLVPAMGLRKAVSAQVLDDQRLARTALRRTRGIIARGGTLNVAVIGDSIAAIQSAAPSQTVPNGATRDRATATGTSNTYLADAVGADVIAGVPLYDTGDGAGQVHTRMSMFWTMIGQMQRIGATVNYLNFAVAGTSSTAAVDAAGALTAWGTAVVNSAADVVVIHFGQNELGTTQTEGAVRALLNACYAAGKECIVIAPPRTNNEAGTIDGFWLRTIRALRRAAETIDPASGRMAAFCDSSLLYSDDNLGALGILRKDMCQANLYNHPGIREHFLEGATWSRIILD